MALAFKVGVTLSGCEGVACRSNVPGIHRAVTGVLRGTPRVPETHGGRAAGRPSPLPVRPTILLMALAAAGCGDARVVEIAYVPGERVVAEVAQETITETFRSGPVIHITTDTAGFGDEADVEVSRANHIVLLPGLVAVVGHAGSRASLASAPVYRDARIPQIVPTGTSRLLRQVGPYTFPLAPDDSVEGAFMARFIAERLGARRVTVFYQNDEYGRGIRDGVTAELARRGVAVLYQSPVDGNSDVATLLDASLGAGRPDVIVAATQAALAGRLMRTGAARLPGVRMVAGDGALLLPALSREAGPAGDSIYCVTFWLRETGDPASRDFVERFRRLSGREPVGSDAMAFDALMLAATAVREVGPDRARVRHYLEALGREVPAPRGVTGALTFRRDRRPALVMVQLRDGVPRRVGFEP